MKQINMHAAKTNLSALVKEAATGEPFAIAINGKPMVKVVPFHDETLPRIGFMKGQIVVPNDFDDLSKKKSSNCLKVFHEVSFRHAYTALGGFRRSAGIRKKIFFGRKRSIF